MLEWLHNRSTKGETHRVFLPHRCFSCDRLVCAAKNNDLPEHRDRCQFNLHINLSCYLRCLSCNKFVLFCEICSQTLDTFCDAIVDNKCEIDSCQECGNLYNINYHHLEFLMNDEFIESS
jgi:hypothetical protein